MCRIGWLEFAIDIAGIRPCCCLDLVVPMGKGVLAAELDPASHYDRWCGRWLIHLVRVGIHGFLRTRLLLRFAGELLLRPPLLLGGW